jgi:4-amino-4-deoxy-L-arabinose transferase-like glycosyltransferase
VFLHPPGVILLLTPFAFIGRLVGTAVANEAARLFILLVALADVALFARVVRMWPLLPATVGLAFFALHPDVVYADTTIYLEPLLIAACLAGTTLVFDGDRFADQRWRWSAAGVAFGIASAIKLWGVFPILAIVVVAVVVTHRRAEAARLVIAGAGAFVVICAPFLALAPANFVRYVFIDQASRSSNASPTFVSRIANMLFLPPSEAAHSIVAVAVVVLVLGIVVWSLVRTRRLPLTELEWYSLASVGLLVGAFGVSGSYYSHYGAFSAAFLGFVACGTVARLMWRGESTKSGLRQRGTVIVTAGLVILVILSAGDKFQAPSGTSASSRSLSRVAAVVPPGRCIVTDDDSILLLSDRFTADYPNCPRVVDPSGTELVLADGNTNALGTTAAVQRAWFSWLERADYMVLTEPPSSHPDWGRPLRRYAYKEFSLVYRAGTVLIYQRVHREIPAGPS